MNTLKIAYIGMGYRGKQLLALTRHIPYFQVTAIADPEAREADYDCLATTWEEMIIKE